MELKILKYIPLYRFLYFAETVFLLSSTGLFFWEKIIRVYYRTDTTVSESINKAITQQHEHKTDRG